MGMILLCCILLRDWTYLRWLCRTL